MIQPSTIRKDDFFSQLLWEFDIGNLNSIYDLDIPPDTYSTLLYNTNDLFLNEEQFNTLMKLIPITDTVYVVQVDSEEVYEFCLPISYEDYTSLNLFSITFLSSKNFNWVIIIDEELESGVGLIISNAELINDFNSMYKNGLKDFSDLISFYYRDASRNALSCHNMIKILSLLRVTSNNETTDLSSS